MKRNFDHERAVDGSRQKMKRVFSTAESLKTSALLRASTKRTNIEIDIQIEPARKKDDRLISFLNVSYVDEAHDALDVLEHVFMLMTFYAPRTVAEGEDPQRTNACVE